jgi:two-component system sensor histidine kinase PhcS
MHLMQFKMHLKMQFTTPIIGPVFKLLNKLFSRQCATQIGQRSPGYEADLQEFRLAFSRTGALTCIAMVLLGSGLDMALYPDRQVEFALLRVLVAVLVCGVLLLLRRPLGKRFLRELSLLWLLLPQMMIAFMIARTEGVDSIYYVGLNLAIYASGIAMPIGLWQNMTFSLLSYALYVLACALHPGGIMLKSAFVINSLFLLFASVSSAGYSYFNERARYMLYLLKAELAEKNREQAAINRNLAEIKGQMLQQEKMAAIGTLAAGLLHEVNNPVNFCLMAIDVGMEEPVAKQHPPLLECLQDAYEGMKRVQHIVTDLKTFAYRKPGTVAESAVFLFEKALDTALRLTSHEVKGIPVLRQMPSDTLVRGDEAAIIGVLINLLSNAALAMRRVRQYDLEIAISATWQGNRLHVTVRDNGPGIPAENLARVFEPFFTTRDVGQGLGLGLAISYRVIEQHDGVLLAESVLGEWTQMKFDLPRAD